MIMNWFKKSKKQTPLTYVEKLDRFKKAIINYTSNIFRVYNNELMLILGDYNLLKHKDNCIQSSTSVGYLMEEFIVSKLEQFTERYGKGSSLGENNVYEYKVQRTGRATNNASYDCCADIGSIRALVNIKVEKQTGQNDAVAAISALYKDIVETDPNTEKCYMVLKIIYDFGLSKSKGSERIIRVNTNYDAYFLDELDFSQEHNQDNRSWGGEKDPNAGRLMVSQAFRNRHSLNPQKISYNNTCSMLEQIIQRNSEKVKI